MTAQEINERFNSTDEHKELCEAQAALKIAASAYNKAHARVQKATVADEAAADLVADQLDIVDPQWRITLQRAYDKMKHQQN